MGPGPIMAFVAAGDVDRLLAKVEKLGCTIVMPKNVIKTVGTVSVIRDTKGNHPRSLETCVGLVRENLERGDPLRSSGRKPLL